MTDIIKNAPTDGTIAALMLRGDTSGLSPPQKVEYYTRLCEYLGLDPVTRPFEFIRLQGREVLYATRACTEQLRLIHGVSITSLTREIIGGVLIVTAEGRIGSRTDTAIGAVPIEGLKGEAFANALMKGETKAKRRLTLSLCGLGMLDESEVDSVRREVPAPPLPDAASTVARINARIRRDPAESAAAAPAAPPEPEPAPEPAPEPEPEDAGPEPGPDHGPADDDYVAPAADEAQRLRTIIAQWSGLAPGSAAFNRAARAVLRLATGRDVTRASATDVQQALIWCNRHRGSDFAALVGAETGGQP